MRKPVEVFALPARSVIKVGHRTAGEGLSAGAADVAIRSGAHDLATLALVAGAIFFTVLFVGFAYEWKTGALDWVKSIRAQHDLKRRQAFPASTKSTPQESILSA